MALTVLTITASPAIISRARLRQKQRLHPLTTPEGAVIRIDLLEPVGALAPIPITPAPMVLAIPLPHHEEIFLEVWATADCTLGFGSVPGLVDYHLRADEGTKLLIPADGWISAQTLGGSGILYVNLLVRWDAARKPYQVAVGE